MNSDNNEIELLREELYNLNEKYKTLNETYNNLNKEYDVLQEEYSENIIIQSMNEMKVRYETMIKSTVPSYKFKFLKEKYDKIIKNYTGCSVLIDHVIKLLGNMESNMVRADNKNILLKAELELVTIKEILEDSVGLK